jgi:hypothetical protein
MKKDGEKSQQATQDQQAEYFDAFWEAPHQRDGGAVGRVSSIAKGPFMGSDDDDDDY